MSSQVENNSNDDKTDNKDQIKGGDYAALVGVIMMGVVLLPMAIIMVLKVL